MAEQRQIELPFA